MKYILVILAAVFLSGCGAQKVEQIAATHVIMYKGLPPMPEGVEDILVKAFTESAIPWDRNTLLEVRGSRNAITSMGDFMKAKSELNGSVPYYNYVSSYEFLKSQYMILQRGLTARTEVPGAVSEQATALFNMVSQRIMAGLENQQDLISVENGKINGMASQDTMNQLKDVYKLVKPLLGAVL